MSDSLEPSAPPCVTTPTEVSPNQQFSRQWQVECDALKPWFEEHSRFATAVVAEIQNDLSATMADIAVNYRRETTVDALVAQEEAHVALVIDHMLRQMADAWYSSAVAHLYAARTRAADRVLVEAGLFS